MVPCVHTSIGQNQHANAIRISFDLHLCWPCQWLLRRSCPLPQVSLLCNGYAVACPSRSSMFRSRLAKHDGMRRRARLLNARSGMCTSRTVRMCACARLELVVHLISSLLLLSSLKTSFIRIDTAVIALTDRAAIWASFPRICRQCARALVLCSLKCVLLFSSAVDMKKRVRSKGEGTPRDRSEEEEEKTSA